MKNYIFRARISGQDEAWHDYSDNSISYSSEPQIVADSFIKGQYLKKYCLYNYCSDGNGSWCVDVKHGGLIYKSINSEEGLSHSIIYYDFGKTVSISGLANIRAILDINEDKLLSERRAIELDLLPNWLNETYKPNAAFEKVLLQKIPQFENWFGNVCVRTEIVSKLNTVRENFSQKEVVAVVVDKLLDILNGKGEAFGILADDLFNEDILLVALECLPICMSNRVSYAINATTKIEGVDIHYCLCECEGVKYISLHNHSAHKLNNAYAQYIKDCINRDPLGGLEDIDSVPKLNDCAKSRIFASQCSEILMKLSKQEDVSENLREFASLFSSDKKYKDSIELIDVVLTICFDYKYFVKYYEISKRFFEGIIFPDRRVKGSSSFEFPTCEKLDEYLKQGDDNNKKLQYMQFLYRYKIQKGVSVGKDIDIKISAFFHSNLDNRMKECPALANAFKNFFDSLYNEEYQKFIGFWKEDANQFKSNFIREYLFKKYAKQSLECKHEFYKALANAIPSEKLHKFVLAFFSDENCDVKDINTLVEIYKEFNNTSILEGITSLMHKLLELCIINTAESQLFKLCDLQTAIAQLEYTPSGEMDVLLENIKKLEDQNTLIQIKKGIDTYSKAHRFDLESGKNWNQQRLEKERGYGKTGLKTGANIWCLELLDFIVLALMVAFGWCMLYKVEPWFFANFLVGDVTICLKIINTVFLITGSIGFGLIMIWQYHKNVKIRSNQRSETIERVRVGKLFLILAFAMLIWAFLFLIFVSGTFIFASYFI